VSSANDGVKPRAARLAGVSAVLLLLMLVTQLGHCGVHPHSDSDLASAVLTSTDHGPGHHRRGSLCHVVAAEQLSSSSNLRAAPAVWQTAHDTDSPTASGLSRGRPGTAWSAPPLTISGRALLVTLGVARS
jgi:hypothetical protein